MGKNSDSLLTIWRNSDSQLIWESYCKKQVRKIKLENVGPAKRIRVDSGIIRVTY